MPVTTPEIESTDATAGFPEDQCPPEGDAVRVVVVPSQILKEPVSVDAEFTVTVAVVKQPDECVYVTDEVPVDNAVMIPLADPTLATDVVAEVQVPPDTAFVNVVEAPAQIVNVPPIADGV